MTPDEITAFLQQRYGDSLQTNPPDAWQVETPDFRLLVLLSADQSWLRLLVPIVPAQDAQSFMAQILDANFDRTQQARYAFHQSVLWGVFHHDRASLDSAQLEDAVNRLLTMKQQGLDPFFSQMVEMQVRKIIAAAKLQGQSLETTMQTLDRFYSEGMMGDLESSPYQKEALSAWRYQLERLWPEVNVEADS
ncbi:MAG: hypothetical protein F6J97_22995 [Leptolyngbya sp. SIO4C1]|nr:hypothetical protein [Leptolyngbya sp. SIO4C1]